MTRSTIIAAFFIAFASSEKSSATVPTPGPAPLGDAIAYYYTWNGEITVSVNGTKSWWVQSLSDSLTGDPVANLPAAGGLVSDNDEVIGETWFAPFTYTDMELGAVAELFLPEGDLILQWDPHGFGPVVYIYIPEPSSIGLISIGLCGVVAMRRRIRA